MPQDYGDQAALLLYWQNWGGFMYFAFNFKGSFAALAATHIYVGFAQYLVYDK